MKNNKGFSVIEILIAVSVITIAFISFLGIVSFSLKSSIFIETASEANFLAQETMESVRSFRDGTDWSVNGLGTLSTDTDYYPSLTLVATPSWTMTLGQETIGSFTRKVVFEKVSRSSGEIEAVYNVLNDDPNTRKILVTVSFGLKSVELTTYLTNWRE